MRSPAHLELTLVVPALLPAIAPQSTSLPLTGAVFPTPRPRNLKHSAP